MFSNVVRLWCGSHRSPYVQTDNCVVKWWCTFSCFVLSATFFL